MLWRSRSCTKPAIQQHQLKKIIPSTTHPFSFIKDCKPLSSLVLPLDPTMTTNTAAWLNASKAGSLEVKSAPYTSPQQGEIVIKNHAVAINPVDWILRDQGNLGFGWLKFPFIVSILRGDLRRYSRNPSCESRLPSLQFKIGFALSRGILTWDSIQLGTDVAEEVIEVGSSVTRFKVGNRVLGQAVGQDKEQNTSAKGGFQTYAVLLADVASHVPSTLSYESAAVLPLGVVGRVTACPEAKG